MPAIASIAINDGKATPETHTFNPIQSVPPIYRENGISTVPVVGQNDVQISLKRSNGDGVNRAKISLRVPVLETTSGSAYSGYVAPPKVAYFMQANVDLLLPNRSTGDQRKDLRVLLSNLLLNAQVLATIDTLEAPF